MGKERYPESHRESGEWLIENVVNTLVDTGTQNTNQHSHTIYDNETGRIGSGSGRSYGEAKSNAESDLGRKNAGG